MSENTAFISFGRYVRLRSLTSEVTSEVTSAYVRLRPKLRPDPKSYPEILHFEASPQPATPIFPSCSRPNGASPPTHPVFGFAGIWFLVGQRRFRAKNESDRRGGESQQVITGRRGKCKQLRPEGGETPKCYDRGREHATCYDRKARKVQKVKTGRRGTQKVITGRRGKRNMLRPEGRGKPQKLRPEEGKLRPEGGKLRPEGGRRAPWEALGSRI